MREEEANREFASSPENISFSGENVHQAGDTAVILPEKPWLPAHAGLELDVVSQTARPLADKEFMAPETVNQDLLAVGRTTLLSAESMRVFAEAENPDEPDWYDKPWFNLNFNSHLEGKPLDRFAAQAYIRSRTLGQARAIKTRSEHSEESDAWSNPYWAVPVPVDEPLDRDDRQPYPAELKEQVRQQLAAGLSHSPVELSSLKLFTDPNGANTLETDFPFAIHKGNYPVWQKGDYLLVTQDNPLVDGREGIHLVLIYRGEQEDESQRFSYHWREPRRIAEMAIISVAASRILLRSDYANNQLDQAYIHLNANWSLAPALPEEQHHPVMDKGSFGPGKWPGTSGSQTLPGPNAHPHIQLIRTGHQLNLGFSPAIHQRQVNERQSDQEIEQIRDIFERELTPTILALQGQILDSKELS